MAKKIFKPEVNYEEGIILIGISCHLKDHRLVHYLNKDYHLDLTRYDDLIVLKEYDKGTEKYLPQNFPFFYYMSEEDYIAYNFIGNRTQNGVLLNEYKQLDFILIMNGAIENYDTKPLINYIKQLPNVLTVSQLKFDIIKNIRPILEDLELHLVEIDRKAEEETMKKQKRK